MSHALSAPMSLLVSTMVDEVDPLASLAKAARDGDARAFGLLYEQTREVAWSALVRLLGPTPDLEDLLQDSYVQLLKALRGFRFDSRVTTFLHRVCVNVGLMYLRGRRRRPEDLDEAPGAELPAPESADPHRGAELSQAKDLLQRTLARLSDEKARVFALHEVLDLKPEEISALEGIPSNTVRSRLNRAREAFTEELAALTGAAR